MDAIDLAKSAANAISDMCFSNLCGHRDPKPVAVYAISAQINDQAWFHGTDPFSVYAAEVIVCFQRGSKFHTPGDSVTQSLTPLRSAGGQDLAAVAGGHALAEAVLLLSVDLLGLIGTLHVASSFLTYLLNSGAGAPQ